MSENTKVTAKQTEKKKNGENYKDQWYWRCIKSSEVNSMLKIFLPYLGKRRAVKTIEALSYEIIS